MVLDNIEATFEFDPQGFQDVTRQQYEMVILGPIPT